jgi:hypothetical protein
MARLTEFHRQQSAAPIHQRFGRNRPKEPTYNRLRRSDQGRPSERRWIIRPVAPDILAPFAPPTLLAYKIHLRLAGTEDTPKELDYCLLLYLRVGSSVVGS